MIKLASGDEKELEGSCRNSKSNTPTRHDANRIVLIFEVPPHPLCRAVRSVAIVKNEDNETVV